MFGFLRRFNTFVPLKLSIVFFFLRDKTEIKNVYPTDSVLVLIVWKRIKATEEKKLNLDFFSLRIDIFSEF